MDVRYRELHWLASLINKVGFNLEFGVFSGRTINCLSSLRPDLSFVGLTHLKDFQVIGIWVVN